MESRERRVAVAFAVGTFLVHALTARGYGWFRDELYYVACGEHLAFGYVDHPPFVALVARLVRTLGGDSPVPLRVVAALTAAGTVWVTGTMAARLGAKAFGVALACLSVLVAPLCLLVDGYYSMNVFDLFFWALAARTSVDLLDPDSPRPARDWLLLGVLLGIGLENKLSIGFFTAGLALGVLVSPARAILRTRGPWLAIGVALLLFLPNVLWVAKSGWSTLEFMNHARLSKNAATSPLGFFVEQLKQMHPVTAPVWMTGLVVALFGRAGKLRPLGVAWLFTLVFFMFGHGKPYYVGAAYPMLFAIGGAAIDGWLRARWARFASLAVVGALGTVTAIALLPILPLDALLRYRRAIGVKMSSGEKGKEAELGQRFADQLGWDTLVAAVAEARDSLPPSERAGVGIYAGNYGEAGAVDVLGPRYGLPRAMSGHNAYWHWGPTGDPKGPILVIGAEREELEEFCGGVRAAARRVCDLCMSFERDLTIWECRDPKAPLATVWPRLKHFD